MEYWETMELLASDGISYYFITQVKPILDEIKDMPYEERETLLKLIERYINK